MMRSEALLLFGDITPRYAPECWDRLAENPTVFSVVALSVLAAAAVACWLSWRERAILKPGRWKTLVVFRLLALVAVVVALAGWQRRPTTEQIDPSRVVLLVDKSTSMMLPDTDSSKSTRAARAAGFATRIESLLSEEHEVVRARFGDAVAYAETEDENWHTPIASNTRLGDGLNQVLSDQQSSPLAGIILLSDGRSNKGANPLTAAEIAAERGVPIHTIGLGPLAEPQSISITRLAVPGQAYSGDSIEVSVIVTPSGGVRDAGELIIEMLEEGATDSLGREVHRSSLLFSPDLQDPSIGLNFNFEAPPAGEYLLEARLTSTHAKEDRVRVSFESVDRKTQVLLVASGPSRDYRFLRNQLRRDKSFEVDVLLQSSIGSVSHDAREVLDQFPETIEMLNTYDTIVAFDPDWTAIGKEAQSNLRDWVADRGGGLLLIPGVAHAFAIGGKGFPTPIARLAPIELGGDPLGALAWDARVDQPQKIKLTRSGEAASFLQLSDRVGAINVWRVFEGFYAAPPKVTPKLGATVYAILGEQESPLLVEQFYGAGRVGYLATGETWRLRQIDEDYFTKMHTKLLRRLSEGRLLGAAARGSLYYDRPRFEVGETMTLRLHLNAPQSDSENGVKNSPQIRLRHPNGEIESAALESAPSGKGDYFLNHDAAYEGKYEATFLLDEGDLSLRAVAEVALPARESLATTRDESTLLALAKITSGEYYADSDKAFDPTDLDSLAARTPSRAEARTVIGPPDREFGEAMAGGSLAALALLLTIEWSLRRLWRLA